MTDLQGRGVADPASLTDPGDEGFAQPASFADPGAPRSTPHWGLDWIMAGLSALVVGGLYLDLWAHAHGEVDDTFFTPWHAAMYVAVAAIAVVLGALGARAIRMGASWRDAVPGPYRLSLVGAVLFWVVGVGDLLWHELFGFEVDTEALLSPTHLALAACGVAMVGGPVRSVLPLRILPPSWRLQGPAVIALTLLLAILGAFTQYAHPIVSPWAEALAGSTDPPPAQLYLMNADGTGQRRLLTSGADDRFPAWSPDGSVLAFVRLVDDQSQIYVVGPDGADPRPLTTDGGNGGPAWSPDGTRIAFYSDRDGPWDLYLMNADGSNVERLTDSPGDEWALSWAPDGRSIAYNSDRAGSFDLWEVDLAGGEPRQLTTDSGAEFDPAWSPDGTSIAFTSDRDGPAYDVYVMAAGDPAGARRLTADPAGTWGSFMPSWSPDGSRILFSSGREGDVDVYTMNADGSAQQNLTRNPGTDDGWAIAAWSPDARTIAYPSQAPLPPGRVEWLRQDLGAAGVLILAGLLAGFALFGLLRGPLPFGWLTTLVVVPAALATVINDEQRFIPGAIVAGLLADLLVWWLGYGRTRWRDAAIAFAVPALFFGAYFATLAATAGIGWSIHLWLGAIVLAGVIGLLLDALVHAVSGRPAIQAGG